MARKATRKLVDEGYSKLDAWAIGGLAVVIGDATKAAIEDAKAQALLAQAITNNTLAGEANINAKQARIAAGSKEKMRKPGTPGAPTAKAFKQSAKTAKTAKKK